MVEKLRLLGSGLVRPESVLTHSSGLAFCSDWKDAGGVAAVGPDGRVHRITIKDPSLGLRPNGIALEPGGTFLVAHLGATDGGVYRVFPDGSVEPVLTEVAGTPLPPSNFPIVDTQGRLWLTVSTRLVPRADDYRPGAQTGFIVLHDKWGARIVADGLGYTNEIAFSSAGNFLYAIETFGRRLTRFAVAPDGSLSEREVVWTFGAGDYPDGLVVDENGDFWATSIVSNRVIWIRGDGGSAAVIVEDSDAAHIAQAEAAYVSNTLGRTHLDTQPAATLRNISSLAFGGPELRTAYLGCLLGDSLVTFETSVPGRRPFHYDFDITPLLNTLDI